MYKILAISAIKEIIRKKITAMQPFFHWLEHSKFNWNSSVSYMTSSSKSGLILRIFCLQVSTFENPFSFVKSLNEESFISVRMIFLGSHCSIVKLKFGTHFNAGFHSIYVPLIVTSIWFILKYLKKLK